MALWVVIINSNFLLVLNQGATSNTQLNNTIVLWIYNKGGICFTWARGAKGEVPIRSEIGAVPMTTLTVLRLTELGDWLAISRFARTPRLDTSFLPGTMCPRICLCRKNLSIESVTYLYLRLHNPASVWLSYESLDAIMLAWVPWVFLTFGTSARLCHRILTSHIRDAAARFPDLQGAIYAQIIHNYTAAFRQA